MRTIEDYYWRRASAALSGDAATIFVERMRNLSITDVRFAIEDREPARVYVKEDRAAVFVHGTETWRYPRGDAMIGEFYTRLDLSRNVDSWLIVRTDEVLLGERPPRTPAP